MLGKKNEFEKGAVLNMATYLNCNPLYRARVIKDDNMTQDVF